MIKTKWAAESGLISREKVPREPQNLALASNVLQFNRPSKCVYTMAEIDAISHARTAPSGLFHDTYNRHKSLQLSTFGATHFAMDMPSHQKNCAHRCSSNTQNWTTIVPHISKGHISRNKIIVSISSSREDIAQHGGMKNSDGE